MSARPGTIERAWHRQPMVWMIIAIPASSVVMGIVMLWLAIASYDGLVVDDYYKRGLEINRVLDRDRAAQQAGLSAQLDLGGGDARLTLAAQDPGFRMPAAVSVELSYATRAGRDQRVEFARTPAGDYTAPPLRLARGRYYVHAGSREWRISGVLEVPGGARVRLAARGAP
jgi:hypothetical protein